LPLVDSALRSPAFRTVRGRLLFWILAVAVPIYGRAESLNLAAAAAVCLYASARAQRPHRPGRAAAARLDER